MHDLYGCHYAFVKMKPKSLSITNRRPSSELSARPNVEGSQGQSGQLAKLALSAPWLY